MGDRKMGLRIRKMRIACGISQMKLAEEIGVSFQQIQKYENGINNVSLERLKTISTKLHAPLSYFIGPAYHRAGAAKKGVVKEGKSGSGGDKFEDLSTEETVLVHRYRSIKNSQIKQAIIAMLDGTYALEKARKR